MCQVLRTIPGPQVLIVFMIQLSHMTSISVYYVQATLHQEAQGAVLACGHFSLVLSR